MQALQNLKLLQGEQMTTHFGVRLGGGEEREREREKREREERERKRERERWLQ